MSRYVSLDLLDKPGEISNQPDEPTGSICPVASLSHRCIAVLLDTTLLFAIFAMVDTWALLRWSLPATGELSITKASLLISTILDAAILFLYLWLLEAAFGATLGKAIVGIRVTWKPQGNHQRSALRASAIRNLLRVVDGVGFYLIGLITASCSRVRQRVGDLCAGTVVVASETSGWTKGFVILLWVSALAGSSWAIPHLYARDHGVHRVPYFGQVVARLNRTDNSISITAARFKLELQRKNNEFASHTSPASAPIAVARSN